MGRLPEATPTRRVGEGVKKLEESEQEINI